MRTLRAALKLQWTSAPVASAVGVVLTIASGLLPTAGALMLKALLDELSTGRPMSSGRVMAYAAGAAGAAGVVSALSHASNYLSHLVRWRVTLTVETALFQKVSGLVGLRELETPSLQGKIRLAKQSAQESPQQLSELVFTLLRAAVAIVSSLALVVLISPWMVCALLMLGGIELAAQLRKSRREAHLSENLVQAQRWQDYYRVLLMDIRAAKEVRLYGLAGGLLQRFVALFREVAHRDLALEGRNTAIQLGLSLLSAGVTAGAAAGVARGVLEGRLQVGDVALFLTSVATVVGSLNSLLGEVGLAARNVFLFRNYLDVLELPDAVTRGTAPAGPLRRGIEVRDAWFRYEPEAPWVLRGLNLSLGAGETVGIVGLNGAGKSTLVKLLCRFWELERGQILWDGVDLRELDPAALRARIAGTFQDFMTYDGTAAENIGFGDTRYSADSERLRAAAHLAGIDDKLSSLPLGYQTLLSRTLGAADWDGAEQHGVALSGGEWQRVALARSLLRSDAELLILDEPSSGLDADAEYQLNQTLQRHGVGKTRLLISHRLSALRDADRIVVLADGQACEQGTHRELLATGGTYARLFKLQASGYEDVAASNGRLEQPREMKG
jgi:ATP-binding cassette subfamily B protein